MPILRVYSQSLAERFVASHRVAQDRIQESRLRGAPATASKFWGLVWAATNGSNPQLDSAALSAREWPSVQFPETCENFPQRFLRMTFLSLSVDSSGSSVIST